MELKDYLRIIQRRWLAVAAIFAMVLGIYFVMVRTMQAPHYASIAEIVIKQNAFELGVFTNDEFVNLITPFPARTAQIRSNDVCKRAAARLSSQVSADTILTAVTVRSNPDQRTVQLIADFGDPELTKGILQAVIDSYKEFDLERARASKENVRVALENRFQQMRERERGVLDERRLLVEESLAAHGVWAPEEQAAQKMQQMSTLEKYRLEIELESAALEEMKRAGFTSDPGLLRPVMSDGSMGYPAGNGGGYRGGGSGISDYAHQEYDRTTAQLAIQRQRYTDEHFKIRELLSQQEVWKGLLREPVVQQEVDIAPIDLQLNLNQERVRVIDTLLEQQWNSLRTFVENRERFDSNKEELQSVREDLRDIRRKQSELDLRIKGEQPAVEQTFGPSEAERLATRGVLSLPFAILVALICAISGGYALEYLSDTIRSAQDCKLYLNLPVIATIPFFSGEPLNLFDAALKSPVAELFNKLATFLESTAVEQHAKTFLFTSSKPEEGKSTISVNAAIAIARGGERVILVDSDLRKPQYHMFFNLDNATGLSTLLAGEGNLEPNAAPGSGPTIRDFLRPTPLETLWVLQAGPVPANPVGLLKSDRLPKLLEALKRHADVVIFDSPPLIGVIDAAIISALVDITILVVSEGQVTRREAAQIKHTLTQVDANVVGAILNKSRIQAEEYYYYYQYYHPRT